MSCLVAVRFPVGISNACAMLQLTSRIDLSVASAAVAASAPRMGNDDSNNSGTSGPSTSVIAKVKPKTDVVIQSLTVGEAADGSTPTPAPSASPSPDAAATPSASPSGAAAS